MKNLLLLHGALGYGGQFDAVRPFLNKSFNVHTPTFIGHGKETLPKELSIEVFAEQIAEYIARNNIKQPHIFGHSMGGYVALYMAAKGMGNIAKIMTLGTKLKWDNEIAAREARMLNTEKMKEKVPSFVSYLKEIHGDKWEQLCGATAEMLMNMGNTPPLTDKHFEKISIPTQLSIGDSDTMVSLEETIAVFRILKTSRLLVMPNTPHPFEKVDTERIAYKISSFFS